MKLSLESIKNVEAWQGYHLPEYNPELIAFNTMVKPEWMHFGSGNIFRIFAGSIAQQLIEQGDMETGIVCCEGYDDEIIDFAIEKGIPVVPGCVTAADIQKGYKKGDKVYRYAMVSVAN